MLRMEKMRVREETMGTQTVLPSQSEMVTQENSFRGASITPFSIIHNWDFIHLGDNKEYSIFTKL